MLIQNLEQTADIMKALKDYAYSRKGFLLLSGKNGTGKTSSALAIYNTFTPFRLPQYDHDLAVFFTQAELNLRWAKNSADHEHLLRVLTETKLLVLDDLGTRTPSESFMDFLYLVIDNRSTYRQEKATIITTNLTAPAMREKFGDPFFSRVASGVSLVFNGRDRRFDAAKT